jgi:chaperone required for assembly of F1-ATPase
MSAPAISRFYKVASSRPDGDGHGVWLDERRLKTPIRLPLTVPTAALAEAIAHEWNAQEARIVPATMPLTALANAAIDRIAPEREAFARRLAAYGAHDLLCYRASEPLSLSVRLAKAWQPILDWLEAHHGARLALAEGIVHVDQPPEALKSLEAAALSLDPFRLAALHVLTTSFGSLGLGLAVLGGRLGAKEAFAISRIDEEFQIERWGHDEEADIRAARIQDEAETGGRFLALLG